MLWQLRLAISATVRYLAILIMLRLMRRIVSLLSSLHLCGPLLTAGDRRCCGGNGVLTEAPRPNGKGVVSSSREYGTRLSRDMF